MLFFLLNHNLVKTEFLHIENRTTNLAEMSRPTNEEMEIAMRGGDHAWRVYLQKMAEWRELVDKEAVEFANKVGTADWFEVVVRGGNTELTTSSASRAYRYVYNNFTVGNSVDVFKVVGGEATIVFSK